MSVCVCPSKSDRHIRAYFFVGLRLVHAFKRFSKLEYVFFSHAVPHFGDVPFNLPLVTLTSILRLPDDASGKAHLPGDPGASGKKCGSGRIVSITETSDEEGLNIAIEIGNNIPTLIEKIKRKMSFILSKGILPEVVLRWVEIVVFKLSYRFVVKS